MAIRIISGVIHGTLCEPIPWSRTLIVKRANVFFWNIPHHTLLHTMFMTLHLIYLNTTLLDTPVSIFRRFF